MVICAETHSCTLIISLQPGICAKPIRTILGRLDVAERIEDMNVHSYHLQSLRGDLKGYYAVTVRSNWRIIFRLEDGDAFDVELIDYH